MKKQNNAARPYSLPQKKPLRQDERIYPFLDAAYASIRLCSGTAETSQPRNAISQLGEAKMDGGAVPRLLQDGSKLHPIQAVRHHHVICGLLAVYGKRTRRSRRKHSKSFSA